MSEPLGPGTIRLPLGVRDYLPDAAARRRGIAEALVGVFERWGYRRIITPAFEYEAVIGRGLGGATRSEAVRFVEPGSGEVVVLRPDITPQVARVVATRMADDAGPIRLCYEGAVVRRAGAGQRELFQAGVELIDAPSPAGEVEVIALAAEALAACGVPRYTLDLGEASLARAALGPVPDAAQAPLRQAIARKDRDQVRRLVATLDLPAAARRLLEALPDLYGDIGVVEKAAALCDDPAARAGLQVLERAVERLVADGLGERLSVDLGEVRGFDYYSGVRVQGYAPGVGDALLSGGRYDGLLARYGRRAGAAGFAVDVERVAIALDSQQPDPAQPTAGLYLAGPPVARGQLALAARRAGRCVVEDLDEQPASDATLRERAARARLACVLRLDADGAALLGADGRSTRLPAAALEALCDPRLAGTPAGQLDAILVAG